MKLSKPLKIFLFGNCQTRVLFNALRSYSNLIDASYVCDVQDFKEENVNASIDLVRATDVFIYQHVNNTIFPISSNELLKNLNPNALSISIPSMYFDGYWPNLLDLYMGNIMPEITDGLLYTIIKNNRNIDYITCKNMYVSLSQSIPEQFILQHIEDSFERLESREILNNVDIPISQWLRENYNSLPLFYSCNHPKKAVFNYVTNSIVSIIESKLNLQLLKNDFYLDYDLTSIDFIIYPVMSNVLRCFGINSDSDLFHRYVRERFSSEYYICQDFFAEYERYSSSLNLIKSDILTLNNSLLSKNALLNHLGINNQYES